MQRPLNLRQVSGIILTIGTAQYILFMFTTQAFTPDYSMATNDISSLGNGPAGLLYNTSTFLVGLAILGCGIFVFLDGIRDGKRIGLLLGVMMSILGTAVGLGGIFPEGTQTHLQVGVVSFLLSGVCAITSAALQKKWWAAFSILMGFISISMGALTQLPGNNVSLPIADGIKERIALYPIFLWALVFGLQRTLSKHSHVSKKNASDSL